MDALKAGLLFFYGTTPSAVAHHTPQAKMVAYTLGGIIAFVTLPFIAAGVGFLVSTHITPELIQGPRRWLAIVAVTAVLSIGIVWIERALVILGDAVAPHWAAQTALLFIRLLMIVLLSVVIAQKWEEALHQGLISQEKLVMRDEKIREHRNKAREEFELGTIIQSQSDTESTVARLLTQLNSLPAHLSQAQVKVRDCQKESGRLWHSYHAAKSAQGAHEARLEGMRAEAAAKAAECKLLDSDIRRKIEAYRAPLKQQLESGKQELTKLQTARTKAEGEAEKSYQKRLDQVETSFNEAGINAEAFARVRRKYPDIDQAVKTKTILLACIELLPLVLKLLLWNSPISAETRALLQAHSAWYRMQTRQSIDAEKTVGLPSWWPAAALPASASPGTLTHRPLHLAPPHQGGSIATSYWEGYENS